MIGKLLLLTTLLTPLLTPHLHAQTATNLQVTRVSHSNLILWFNISGSYNYARIRYIKTSEGSCKPGTGGIVDQVRNGLTDDVPGPYYHIIVGGLAANTQYEICPELTTGDPGNFGSTWTKNVGILATTLPLPAVHPAPPKAPLTFDTSYPDTTSYTPKTLTTNCSNWTSVINEAVDNQDSLDTIIYVPANAVCEGQYVINRQSRDVTTFATGNVNLSQSRLNITLPWLSEGHGLQLDARYGCLPGSNNDGNQCKGKPYVYTDLSITGPLQRDHVYYACNVAGSSFQLCKAPISQGGTPIDFSSGTTGGGTMLINPWPRQLRNIIIRTDTPDNQFAPPGTRVGPQWASKMPKFRPPLNHLGDRNLVNVNLTMATRDTDEGNVTRNANIRFVGLEFTVPPYTPKTSDMPPLLGWLHLWGDNLVVDRCYFYSPGPPYRIYNVLTQNGVNVAVIDSYTQNANFFHMTNYGFSSAVTGNKSVIFQPGDAYYGYGAGHLTNAVTINITGVPPTGVYQRAFVYFDSLNRFTVQVPQGTNASCAGASCVVIVSTSSYDGDFSASFSDWWPRTPEGWIAVGMVGVFDVDNTGKITSTKTVTTDDLHTYDGLQWSVREGCDCMYGGHGPGPLMTVNNHFEHTGNVWHYDNASYNYSDRRNYYIVANEFTTAPYTRPMDAAYDHHIYMMRQLLEFKGGENIYIAGNTFRGGYNDVAGNALGGPVFANRDGYGERDVLVEYNVIEHTPGAMLGATSYEKHQAFLGTPSRYWFRHNLVWDINGSGVSYGQNAYQNDANGWGIQGIDGSEDVVVDHNTFAGMQGRVPVIYHMDGGAHNEGTTITNNVFSVDYTWKGFNVEPFAPPPNQTVASGAESCKTTLVAEALFKCSITNGVFSNNLLIPNVSDTACPHQGTQGSPDHCIYNTTADQVTALFPQFAALNYITSVTDLNQMGWFKHMPLIDVNLKNWPDYRWSNTSPYISGGASKSTDKLDIGVDFDELQRRRGFVTGVGAVPGSTSAKVNFVAPNSSGCSVDYSNSDQTLINSFTRINDPGGNRVRSIDLPSLTAHTLYYYRVNCASQQPTGMFATN